MNQDQPDLRTLLSTGPRLGGVTVQIVRDWVLRFKPSELGGLVNGKAPGNRSKLNDDEQRWALADVVNRGPIPQGPGALDLQAIPLWPGKTTVGGVAGIGYAGLRLGRPIGLEPKSHAQRAELFYGRGWERIGESR